MPMHRAPRGAAGRSRPPRTPLRARGGLAGTRLRVAGLAQVVKGRTRPVGLTDVPRTPAVVEGQADEGQDRLIRALVGNAVDLDPAVASTVPRRPSRGSTAARERLREAGPRQRTPGLDGAPRARDSDERDLYEIHDG
jgi:hypothetical protein